MKFVRCSTGYFWTLINLTFYKFWCPFLTTFFQLLEGCQNVHFAWDILQKSKLWGIKMRSFLKSFFASKLYKLKRKNMHFWRSFLEAFWKAEGAKSVKGSSKSSILGVVKKEAFWASWGSSFLIKWGPRRTSFCVILNDFWMHFWTPMSSLAILRWGCGEPAVRLRWGCDEAVEHGQSPWSGALIL